MHEEMNLREVVAQKKPSEKRMVVFGAILCVLAALAGLSAVLNAQRGYGYILLGCVMAVFAAALAAYAFVFYAVHKKMPDALVYAEGELLYVYQYKKKTYVCLDLSEIKDAEGGILPRDNRQGILRIRTGRGVFEVPEVANVLSAKEKILRYKYAAEKKKD